MYAAGKPSAAFPAGELSQGWAKPIQQEPSPSAWVASIRFSAASEQSSTAHGLAATAEITINAGA